MSMSQPEGDQERRADCRAEMAVYPVAARFDDGGVEGEIGAAPGLVITRVGCDHREERPLDIGDLTGGGPCRSEARSFRFEQCASLEQRLVEARVRSLTKGG